MANHLLDSIKKLITSDWLLQAASETGETPDAIKSAMTPILGAVASGFAGKASTEEGATQVLSLLNAVTGTGSLSDIGKRALSLVFGPRLSSVIELIGGATGLRPGASSSLLTAGAGLATTVLNTIRRDEHFDAHGLSSYLKAERGAALKAAPAGISQILELGGFPFRHFGPMLASGALLLAVPLLYRSCERPVVAEHPKPVVKVEAPKPDPNVAQTLALPGGVSISVKPGTINYELVQFLKSSEPVPKTFVFDNLNFNTGTTVVTAESRPTISDLVAILKAYPAVDVRLEGHTDNQGNPASNLKLSRDRAAAIKTTLEASAIAAARIGTEGFGQNKPMAPNDTEEGRAKNRRLELVVVKK